jgi:plastocyanin
MRRFVVLLIAVAALVAAGCGSSNSNSGSSNGGSSSPATTSSTTSSSSSGGKTVTIDMQNIRFSPASQTVKVGQKVVWVNKDPLDHNVIAQSGASFKSNNYGQGASFSFTPTKAGTIKYTCTLHPGMDGTLTVTK